MKVIPKDWLNKHSPPSEKRLIDSLKINYGIDVSTLTVLPLGADMEASVYKAEAHDQSSYFVKLKRGELHDISAIVIELLRNAGIQYIIPIIKTIVSWSHNSADWRLYPYGIPLYQWSEWI